jgi:hypothetical protein
MVAMLSTARLADKSRGDVTCHMLNAFPEHKLQWCGNIELWFNIYIYSNGLHDIFKLPHLGFYRIQDELIINNNNDRWLHEREPAAPCI